MLQVQCIGNLGADAERKEINGKVYSSFRMGVRGRSKDDTTTWVNVLVGFRDALHGYLKKGQQVYVAGDMRVSLFTRRDGSCGFDVSCFASTLELCGGVATAPAGADISAGVKAAANNAGFWQPDSMAQTPKDGLPF